MTFDSIKAGRITTSQSYCTNHSISRQAYSRHVMMLENYARIREWYDPTRSVTENYQTALSNGFKVCLRTLQRYCKYNNIPASPDKVEIKEWYHPWLSVARNLHYAELSGIKVS